MDDKPDHQKRINPTLGDWVDALLLRHPCAKCGEPLLHRKNCQYDHDPPLADRFGEEWEGIHPNDPRFVQLIHIDCHRQKTDKEHTDRSKAKRAGRKHAQHLERLQNFKLPSPTERPKKKVWPSRPFPKKQKR